MKNRKLWTILGHIVNNLQNEVKWQHDVPIAMLPTHMMLPMIEPIIESDLYAVSIRLPYLDEQKVARDHLESGPERLAVAIHHLVILHGYFSHKRDALNNNQQYYLLHVLPMMLHNLWDEILHQLSSIKSTSSSTEAGSEKRDVLQLKEQLIDRPFTGAFPAVGKIIPAGNVPVKQTANDAVLWKKPDNSPRQTSSKCRQVEFTSSKQPKRKRAASPKRSPSPALSLLLIPTKEEELLNDDQIKRHHVNSWVQETAKRNKCCSHCK
jgi:hypothetical protein